MSAYSLCYWRWITHFGTNLLSDHHVRTLLEGNCNILGTIWLKTEIIIFETVYSFNQVSDDVFDLPESDQGLYEC